jgi:hypothetical protein
MASGRRKPACCFSGQETVQVFRFDPASPASPAASAFVVLIVEESGEGFPDDVGQAR